jgi:hypothetical protein
MINTSIVSLVAAGFIVLGCSNSEFSADSGPGVKSEAKVTSTDKTTQDAKKPLDVFFIGDFTGMVWAQGTAGSCQQSALTAGKNLFLNRITPAIKSLGSANFINGSINDNSDALIGVAAQVCPASESSWAGVSLRIVCKKNGSSLGANQLDQYFGPATVCGNSIPDQTPFAFQDSPIRPLLTSGSVTDRHLIVGTVKRGSSMSAEMFIGIVRKHLGSNAKVSVVYPKNPAACDSAGITPPASDAYWLQLPGSALQASNVFEEIASKTGGYTYDLCDPAQLDKVGSKP